MLFTIATEIPPMMATIGIMNGEKNADSNIVPPEINTDWTD
jgi:hypothetical protein